MAVQRLNLTRDQLASFLQDFEQIKQFEKLFATVDTINTVTLDEISVSADSAFAAANEALAQISGLLSQTEFLALAPPDLGGTVTSVGLSGGTTGLTVSGTNPITSSGTFTLGGTLVVANGGTGATNATDARANLVAAKSGANSDITSLSGITGGISLVDNIDFDTAAVVAGAVGRLVWNDGDGTLDLGLKGGNVTLQIGQEEVQRSFNEAGVAIVEGNIIYVSGAQGNRIAVSIAQANAAATSLGTIGMATENLAIGAEGFITTQGLVRKLNTILDSEGNALAEGDLLYLSATVLGGYTKIRPDTPNFHVFVGYVVRVHASVGSIFIRPNVYPSVDEINGIKIVSTASGNTLIYDAVAGYYKTNTLTAGTGVSITNGAGSITINATGTGGTVTSVSVVSANGLAGTVANATTTPAITLSTSVTGIVKGNGTALSAASAGTDYVAPGAYTTSGLTMATARILGRTTASTGAAEEITVGTGLTLATGSLINAAPDQVVSLTGAGTTSISGTYPSFTITSNDAFVGTVTSVSGTGTVNGITLTGTVTSSGSLTLGGTLSGVSLTTQVSGTLPVANGGTNASTFTAGSVVFAGTSGTYTQSNAQFFWDNTNSRLGIGTTTTANKITASVSSAGAAAGIISLVNPNDTAGTAADLDFNCHSSGTLATGRIRGLVGGASDYPMSFWTYGSSLAERMRIDKNGNIGIGTTAPTPTFGSKVLQVTGTADARSEVRLTHTTSGAGAADGFSLLLVDADTYVYNRENGSLIFGTNNAARMQITSAGDIGIGTSAPSTQFAVIPAVNPATATGTLQTAIGEASNNSAYQMRMGYYLGGTYQGVINVFSGGVGADLLLNPSGGKVGIGTTTPAYQLQLSTDSAAKPTSALWTIASDSRVKTETGEYTKGLDAVCALRPITYQYNGAAGFVVDGKENISIIAQEAMQHFPECVGTFEALLNEGDEEKTKLYDWNGHALTFALVNAVKELKAANDALAARIAQLEGK